MSDGQIAVNTNDDSPGLFIKDAGGVLVKIGPVHIGTSAPNATPASGGTAGNSKGELWLDSTNNDYSLKTWDGSAWREIVVTSAMIKDGTVVNADISASAAIGLSKLATGALPSGITVASSNIVDGTIVNADINASAAIVDTKLATISTAGKVSNSATTATSSNTANAIVTRDASGNFTAGTITANLSGNVTGNLTGTASAIADNTVTSAKIVDGAIVNADINASAGIVDTKLATISTAGKVSNSATTATNANTASAIVARDGSGNFSAGTITATLSGSATALNTSNTYQVGAVGVGTAAGTGTVVDVAGRYAQTVVAVGALDINCSLGNYFTKTINANSTFTVSNVPASRSYSFTLELTHTSGTVTWFSGVEFPSGVTPTLTTGKTHLFMFVTDDGGTRWRAAALTNYTN
jgi:hypothetical protein